MSDDTKVLNKAEKLALVGAVAPHLRDQSDHAAHRRVARIDAEGNIVGYTTLLEVQKSLLARHALEISVQPNEKVKEVFCAGCGLPVKVARTGRPVRYCGRCKSARCSRCGQPLKKGGTAPAKNRKRRGAPLCIECIARRKAENTILCVACRTPIKTKNKRLYRGTKARTPQCQACYQKALRSRRAKNPEA